MSKILTITLNPTIDKSTSVSALVADQKLRCSETKFEPGGGGINVSRAIKRLGGASKTWFLAGGEFGDFFVKMIAEKQLDYTSFKIQNQTRQSLILFEESSNKQFLLDSPGPAVHEPEWQALLDGLANLQSIEYIVASGSLPPGIPTDFYARIAKIAKNKSMKFVLDSSGEALKYALEAGVYMCKPNLRELGLLCGIENMDIETAKNVAQKMLNANKTEIMIVSLGAQGGLLVSKQFTTHILPPAIEKKSTVGAGDSMVAGMVFSLSNGKNMDEAFAYGIACGTAATMNPGTMLCKKEDADNLYLQIKTK